MKKLTLKVSGMHCGSCEMLITDALKDLGVKSAEAFHKIEKVVVEYDENKISEKQIKKAIEAEGYKVK